ncbi:translocation/assembly module TamB domain-containing protein [Colwellia piezophila]|uniref:translocation/assembly module TamB domain-containing protein n=1 Tax=Colwellia piezophila TaxID=211668 RepID=UPI00146BFCC6|nr:translocation/assembly module TamB domain-containing protein [Colwellia piezophila]
MTYNMAYKFTYKVMKWLILLFCLGTVLLTTPIGSQLTVSLLNNIDGFNADYKAGSLIRDIELNSFHLELATIDIKVTDLAAVIDFSCSWRKTLCIETLKVANFSLTYANETEGNHDIKPTIATSIDKTKLDAATVNIDSLFVMPFAIEAKAVELSNSYLAINQTVIAIEQFTTQVDIKASQFTFNKPTANKLTITLEKSETGSTSSTTQKLEAEPEPENKVYAAFSTLPEVNLPISLAVQQLFVEQLRIIELKANRPVNISVNNDEPWPYLRNHLTATWSNNDVNITDFKTSTADYEIKQSALKTVLIPPYQINAQVIAQLDNVPHWPQASNSTVELNLQGSFAELSANITSNGSVSLSSQGKINLTHPQLPFELQLSADKLPLPLSLAQYGKPSSLSFDVTGDLVEQTLHLTSQLNSYGYKNAQLKVSARHQQGLITLNELAFNEKNSNSQLGLHGHIDLQSTATSWQLFADSSGFSLPKIDLKALVFPSDINSTHASTNVNANTNVNAESQDNFIEDLLPDVIKGRISGKIGSSGSWSSSKWAISVNDTDVSGFINDSEFLIKGDIALNQSGYFSSGDLAQGELLVVFDKDQLTLQTVDDNNWHVNGQLTIAEINRWYPFANGTVTSDFSIKGSKNDPVITLNTQLNNLHWQQFYSPMLNITASYQPFNNHKTQLTVKNDWLDITDKSSTTSIPNIFLNIAGDLAEHQLQLNWQGELAGNLTLSGQWHEAQNNWQGAIEEAALTYQQETLRNNHVFSLNFNLNDQQLRIEKHCWQGSGIEVCLPFDAIVGESGELTLALNLDLSLIDKMFLPNEVQLQSKISGDITAQWSPTQALSAQADFALSSGNIKITDQYNDKQVSQWRFGELSFKVNETKMTSKFQLQDGQEKPLINITSSIHFTDELPIDELPLEAQIELNQFNLQPFQALIHNVIDLQGYVTAELAVHGTIKAPLINGKIALDGGELLLSQNPNKLEKVSAELQINNNQAEILAGFFIQEDKATLNGHLAWQDGFTVDIDLHAKQLPIVFPPQLIAKISPTLNFSLKEKVLTISGMLNVLEGSYNIEKLPQGSIKLSDDVIFIDDQGKELFKQRSGIVLKTDVSLNIAKAFTVSGQGLESNLFGQLQITQQPSKPLQLFGNIQSENGTYQAYGQKLTIEKGEISFNGPLTNPYFNLRASRHIKSEDIEVGLKITGLADALDIQLFSTPTMEAPEMLSYLARGRGLDSGGGSSTAAASMLIGFGVTNSVGIIDQLEKVPLISNIAVDTEGEGDTTQATISGYIGERVYLKYGIGVYEPINELTVRLYLLNRLWLEVVSGIEKSSDLYYSFDID